MDMAGHKSPHEVPDTRADDRVGQAMTISGNPEVSGECCRPSSDQEPSFIELPRTPA
jgi:hypothetical protein